MTNFYAMEVEASSIIKYGLTLTPDLSIPGQVDPYGGAAEPRGIMVKGPFDNGEMTVQFREQGGVADTVIMEASYDLDYDEVDIDADVDLAPDRTSEDAATTWEEVDRWDLAKLGSRSAVINWGTAGLSKSYAPAAIRFRLNGNNSGTSIRIDLGENNL